MTRVKGNLIVGFIMHLSACTFNVDLVPPRVPPEHSKCLDLQQVPRFALVKLDHAGSVLWEKSFDTPSAVAPILVQVNADGGYAATFTTNDFQTSIAFFDPAGTLKSQKVIAESSAAAYVHSFEPTTDGGYVAAGLKHLSGNADFWIIKLDKSGSIQWEKTLGGSNVDRAYSIRQTEDLGFIVAGSASSNDGDVIKTAGVSDFWIIKLTQSGTVEWKKTFGGCGDDIANSVRQTKDGGYIVAGMSYVDACGGQVERSYDFGVLKLNGSGEVQWQKYLGGRKRDWAWSIGQGLDGGYYVAGITDSNDGDVSGLHGISDIWVVKLDESGGIKWQKALGGHGVEEGYSIHQTGDGGYIMCGLTSSNDGDVTQDEDGDENFWIVKLSESNAIQWEISYGDACWDKATSIQATRDGGYIVAGTVVE